MPMLDANPGKILMVGPAWVGDMVIAQSAFKTCKSTFPAAQLTVLAPRYTCALLSRMPEVDVALEFPLGHGELALAARRRFGLALRAQQFDWSIVLPNTFKSALVPYWAGIPIRTGYFGELRWGVLNDIRQRKDCSGTRLVDRYNYLVNRPGTTGFSTPRPALAIDPAAQRQVLDRLQLQTVGPTLALCPGAEYGPAKRWPAEYFAAVARQQIKHGWRVWVLGTTADLPQAEAICRAAGPACINLAGRTSLTEAVDLLSLVQAVVTNDSGLMHIASSLACKVISIFGSTDPGNTPPLGNEAGTLSVELPCRPCFARVCRYGHNQCLHAVTPDRVLDNLPQ